MMRKEKTDGEYHTIIRSHRSWFYVDIKGLLQYRDLFFFLIRREFLSKYKQTVLGPAWFVLQPLLMTLVFTVIFGKAIKIPTDGLPPILFYLCGLLPWHYFAQCLNSISTSLQTNAPLLTKVYFPRLIIPLSLLATNLISFTLQLVMLLGFCFYYKYFTVSGLVINANLVILILPLLLLQTAAISFGVGLFVAALTVKYRDFQHLMVFLTQLWMYLTPIIYSTTGIPENWRFVMALNPMAQVVENYRYAFLGTGFVNVDYMLVSVLITVVVCVMGILFFNKVERTFVDII